MQSINLLETYVYGISKDLVSEKEEIKCKTIIKWFKTKLNWMMLRKNDNINNSLFNLTNQQLDIDKIYFYAKDPYEAKYQLLIKKQKSTGLKHLNDSKAFIEYWNDTDHIYKILKNTTNANKKRKIIVFDDMTDMLSINKLNPVVAELFIRGRKLNISFVFIAQSYFATPKNIRLNSMHYFIMKIANKLELQQTVFNHSSGIDFKDWMNLYKKCTAQLCYFLVIDATLAPDNPSRFRNNIKTNHKNW